MHARALVPIAALAALSHSAALLPRDATNVLAHMDMVVQSISKVNATLNTFKPADPLGVFTALKVQNETKQLTANVGAVIVAANASTPFSATDSQRLVDESRRHKLLIASLLGNVVAHKPAFESAVLVVGDVSKSVRSLLVQAQTQVAAFAAAVQAKCAPGYVIPETQMVGVFEAAIQQFDTCGGVVCLPDLSGY